MKLGRFDVPGHYTGDCRELLAELPEGCVQTCVTSPPYWGLRDYGVDGQLGLEATPPRSTSAAWSMCFAASGARSAMTARSWLNIGDCYAGSGRGGYTGGASTLQGSTEGQEQSRIARGSQLAAGFHETRRQAGAVSRAWTKPPPGLKAKDLVGVPWMLAFALRADGWFLRADVIWSKPNPLPEPVADRPTKAHEYIFLLSKSSTYFYDADAIREPCAPKTLTAFNTERRSKRSDPGEGVKADNWARDVRTRRAKVDADGKPVGANKRSVWTVGSQPYDGAHFATFPPKLIEPCVLAGSRPGDVVLDPFFGSGTTGEVAAARGRNHLGFDLNPRLRAAAAGACRARRAASPPDANGATPMRRTTLSITIITCDQACGEMFHSGSMRRFALRQARKIGWLRAKKEDWCPAHAKGRLAAKRAAAQAREAAKAQQLVDVRRIALKQLASRQKVSAQLVMDAAGVGRTIAARVLGALAREGLIRRGGACGYRSSASSAPEIRPAKLPATKPIRRRRT